MSPPENYDVVVLGGGLAGLCLSIQLRKSLPDLRVRVLERGRTPRPEGAHTVGESSVEIASHYFRNVLGVEDLIDKEIRKCGLRFYMSDGENLDIAKRLEIGPKNYLTMPSDQIDRGQFENGLAERAESCGVELTHGVSVTAVEMATEGDERRLHRVRFQPADDGAEASEVTARWVVDASGRAGLLKKKLGLARMSRHKINAAWFRIDHPINIDDWSEDSAWRCRTDECRRMSTNHLMGEGYWVWLIPLVHGRTSVGIVADEEFHPFGEINTIENAMDWIGRHEPQAARILGEHLDAGRRMDFRALRRCAHDTRQVFSGERWALTGDAGIFIDALYSPGSDFIGMSNCFISDLVARDLRGEDIEVIAPIYDKALRSLSQTYLVNYYRQYRIMGTSHVMTTKIVWDFVMYWGGVANLFCGDRFCEPSFMSRVNPLLQSFAFTNLKMQAFFRDWAKATDSTPRQERIFIDYAGLGFLAELNSNLADTLDDEALIERTERNLALARDLRLEILAEAGRTSPSFAEGEPPPTTGYLDKLFETLRLSDVEPAGTSTAL